MKAAVYKGNRRFQVEDLPTPTPGPGQVLIKVKYSAICGTDVHGFLHDAVPPGKVLGHEFCGTVAKVGPEVSRWKEGDRVVGGGGTLPPGMEQGWVRNTRFNYRTMGETGKGKGGYAEYVLMQDWGPSPVPEGVSDAAAALCEPCSVAVRAVRNSDLRLGDTVGILGAGPIGLLCLQAARAAGAQAVFVAEPASARREAALELGADEVIDPSSEDVVSRMVSLGGDFGPQVVFECAGAKATLDQALNMVPRLGQVVLVALAWEPTSVLPVDWIARELKVKASFGSLPEDWRISLELIESGKISMEPLLSEAGFIPLEEVQQALEALIRPTTQRQMVVNLEA